MVQTFRVLRCYKCEVFQVDMEKKSSKWQCKMCGERQSLKQVFAKGSGVECRKAVQEMNLKRMELGRMEEQRLEAAIIEEEIRETALIEEENKEKDGVAGGSWQGEQYKNISDEAITFGSMATDDSGWARKNDGDQRFPLASMQTSAPGRSRWDRFLPPVTPKYEEEDELDEWGGEGFQFEHENAASDNGGSFDEGLQGVSFKKSRKLNSRKRKSTDDLASSSVGGSSGNTVSKWGRFSS